MTLFGSPRRFLRTVPRVVVPTVLRYWLSSTLVYQLSVKRWYHLLAMGFDQFRNNGTRFSNLLDHVIAEDGVFSDIDDKIAHLSTALAQREYFDSETSTFRRNILAKLEPSSPCYQLLVNGDSACWRLHCADRGGHDV
eukprot:scpid76000/ scgid15369/ 